MTKIKSARAFFAQDLYDQDAADTGQSEQGGDSPATPVTPADGEDDDIYMTSNMALEAYAALGDGSYHIAVRDMGSLDTSIMVVPADTPGIDMLSEGLADLTITYALDTEFVDDLDYRYIVTDIDYADMDEDVYLVTGTVVSVAEDGRSLVLDLNGISEFELDIRDGVTAPVVGTYLCARYAFGYEGLDLVGYDELDAPRSSSRRRTWWRR